MSANSPATTSSPVPPGPCVACGGAGGDETGPCPRCEGWGHDPHPEGCANPSPIVGTEGCWVCDETEVTTHRIVGGGNGEVPCPSCDPKGFAAATGFSEPVHGPNVHGLDVRADWLAQRICRAQTDREAVHATLAYAEASVAAVKAYKDAPPAGSHITFAKYEALRRAADARDACNGLLRRLEHAEYAVGSGRSQLACEIAKTAALRAEAVLLRVRGLPEAIEALLRSVDGVVTYDNYPVHTDNAAVAEVVVFQLQWLRNTLFK